MYHHKMSGLKTIYKTLYAYYGDLHWWPAQTPLEVMVGAILTQNTAWHNVEKALSNFTGDLSAKKILSLSLEELQSLIRPAGFYKQKAKYLRALSKWFISYDSNPHLVKSRPLKALRPELLRLPGIGNETADSILLYAFDFPSFVVDAYTLRLFSRMPVPAGRTYDEIKQYCEQALPNDISLYKNFHALIVENGKAYCKKKPTCPGCPLEKTCKKIELAF